jgi:hypothetical protein
MKKTSSEKKEPARQAGLNAAQTAYYQAFPTEQQQTTAQQWTAYQQQLLVYQYYLCHQAGYADESSIAAYGQPKLNQQTTREDKNKSKPYDRNTKTIQQLPHRYPKNRTFDPNAIQLPLDPSIHCHSCDKTFTKPTTVNIIIIIVRNTYQSTRQVAIVNFRCRHCEFQALPRVLATHIESTHQIEDCNVISFNCLAIHLISDKNHNEYKSRNPCFNWMKGKCYLGPKCHYVHDIESRGLCDKNQKGFCDDNQCVYEHFSEAKLNNSSIVYKVFLTFRIVQLLILRDLRLVSRCF